MNDEQPAGEAQTSGQQQPAGDEAWWMAPGEAYWKALLEQGEIVTEVVPPADPQELLYYAPILDSETGTPARLPLPDRPRGSDDGWDAARSALAREEVFSLSVVGANRGGLLVEWNGLQGFVPASHLRDMPRTRQPQDRATELARRIGERLSVRLIEVDEAQGRLVFSERMAQPDPSTSSALLSSLHPGDTCQGRVTNLTAFGAFVDLGGVEGLIHISEMSWDRLRHPGDMLHPGDEVQVYVLGVNPDEGRVALSLKRLRPNPWTRLESHYRVGQLIEGTVTNVVSFGAFVRVEEGLEGLIHISELGDGGLTHARNAVREGEQVRVRVVHIDTEKRRLGLSLRQAHDAEPMGKVEA